MENQINAFQELIKEKKAIKPNQYNKSNTISKFPKLVVNDNKPLISNININIHSNNNVNYHNLNNNLMPIYKKEISNGNDKLKPDFQEENKKNKKKNKKSDETKKLEEKDRQIKKKGVTFNNNFIEYIDISKVAEKENSIVIDSLKLNEPGIGSNLSKKDLNKNNMNNNQLARSCCCILY